MQEFTSKNTSINKNKKPKIYSEVLRLNGWQNGAVNLDIGGGRFDTLSDALMEKFSITNLILDPYNRTEKHNQHVLELIRELKPHSSTISNVLNVIKEPHIRAQIITSAFHYLRDGGMLYVTVYEGDLSKTGRQTGVDKFQMNQPLSFYMDEIGMVFNNVSRSGKVIFAKK